MTTTTEQDRDTDAPTAGEPEDGAQTVPGDDGAAAVGADLDAAGPAPVPGRLPRGLRHWRQIAAGAALCGSVALVAALYLGPHRSDDTAAAARTAVVAAASEGTVALLTYAPDTMAADLAAAQSHLTGEFLTYYSDFAEKIVAPAAKDNAVHASATVVRAATADVDGNHAQVLVFLNQSTTSNDRSEPAQTASSVMVGMTKVDGRWLISSFNPF